MAHGTTDIPLMGGYASAGVVRVGDTVRRAKGPNSRFVQDLLTLLEEIHCECAPRHLGFDASGREMLTFVHGEVFPRWRDYSTEQVEGAARMLRLFHDATRGSDLARGHETVCHYDPGPHNAIFRDDMPYAWIDFDFAAPGPALDDLGYLAWSWCLSSSPARMPVEEQAGLVAIAADAYGLEGPRRANLVDAILGRLIANIDYWAENVRHPGLVPVTPEKARELRDWSLTEFAFVRAHRVEIERALKTD